MKNETIHDGLEHKNVRDFLAKNLCSGYMGQVEDIESKIQQLQKELEQAKQYEAIMGMIRLNGWEDWDVSDYISDYTKDEYFQFIGTEEELSILLNDIYREE